MSAIERLKSARSIQSVAVEIEPLAQALASLADDTRTALNEVQQNAAALHTLGSEQQREAAKTVEDAAQELRRDAQALSTSAQDLTAATRHLTRNVLLVGIGSGVLAAALTTGLWHWLPQLTESAQRQQRLGAVVEARLEKLTPAEREQLIRLMRER